MRCDECKHWRRFTLKDGAPCTRGRCSAANEDGAMAWTACEFGVYESWLFTSPAFGCAMFRAGTPQAEENVLLPTARITAHDLLASQGEAEVE